MTDETEKEGLMDLEYKKGICELDLSHWESKLKLKKEFDLDCSDIFGYRTECLNRLSWLGEQIEEYKQQEELKKQKEKGGKLKTLKDLIEDVEPLGLVVNPQVLKKEVIEWIKELKNEDALEDIDLEITIVGGDNESTINWIKHFFNISEEDLQ